ncbi:MAG TPA: hypothetical protein VEF34_08815 [Syntrophobacteraceae bacterium]|nr:hypothetical protein [Syntrophobacteraceae bacterium]
MQPTRHILERLLTEKKALLRLFTIATVLAFAVGTLGRLFAAQTFLPTWAVVSVSVCLVVIAFALLSKDLVSILAFQDKVGAVLFVDSSCNELVQVKDYRFAEQLYKTMRAIKAESKSVFAEWERNPLAPDRGSQRGKTTQEVGAEAKPSFAAIVKMKVDMAKLRPKSVSLLEEAAVFVLLEELSLHLSAYFNIADEDSYIKEYSRKDIPEFLLRNRVLNLLCTPIEQRDVFLNAFPEGVKKPEGEIYALYGSDGTVYSRFDMVLPKGSTIKHLEGVGIRIETPRLCLDLLVRYTGLCAVVSPAFIHRYVCRNPETIECRNLDVTVRGRIKPVSLLFSRGWQYYRWLDSFRERLRASFDFEEFMSDIHWSVIEPLLFSMSQRRTTGQQRPPAPEDCRQTNAADVPPRALSTSGG